MSRSGALAAAEIDLAISATAEGYAFPTNLDRDPPVGGLAPKSQAAQMREALKAGIDPAAFGALLDKLAERRRSH
jgi:ectoine hydroxylase-related dioxygenase (phytanoyl-CoA dioxygenase family)